MKHSSMINRRHFFHTTSATVLAVALQPQFHTMVAAPARSAARGYDPLDNKGVLHELDLPHTNNYTDHWLPTGFRIVLSEGLLNP